MTKRAAVWAIMGLWATAMVLGVSTHAIGEERGVPVETPSAQNGAADVNGQQQAQVPDQQQLTTPNQGEQGLEGEQGEQGLEGEGAEGGEGGNGQETTLLQQLFLPLMLGAFVLLWIFGSRKSKAAEKQRQEMLSNLKKGDRVTSIGGIIGTVVDVRDNEVVVKVDDTANTRLRFLRKAISHVGTAGEEGEGEKK